MKIELPRPIPLAQDSIHAIDLHVFADVSIEANCAAAYAVVYRPSSVNQGLVTRSCKFPNTVVQFQDLN